MFIDEITRLRGLRSAWAPEVPVGDEQDVASALDQGLGTLAMLSLNCPLMGMLILKVVRGKLAHLRVCLGYQLLKIQEAYAAI